LNLGIHHHYARLFRGVERRLPGLDAVTEALIFVVAGNGEAAAKKDILW
jgi:hypothetical protein